LKDPQNTIFSLSQILISLLEFCSLKQQTLKKRKITEKDVFSTVTVHFISEIGFQKVIFGFGIVA